jgi:dTDP-4-amino-4,6-dideoxygalactose transaminase
VGENLLLDPRKTENAITLRTRAILAVHIYGRLCRAEPLNALSYKHQLMIVEDCSESHGAPSGLDSMAKCWSFYRNKIIFGEEGGAVAFGCEDDAERARMLRSHGFTARHDFMHIPRGWNYRLANALALPILRSLDHYEKNLRQRRLIESIYNQLIPPEYWQPPRAAPWVYDVRLPRANHHLIDTVVKSLNEQGVAARHGFKPMSMQPEYLRPYAHLTAYWRGREVMYLPICPTMTDDQVVRSATLFLRERDAAFNGKT